MAISLKKISKLIDLDLSDVPKEDRTSVKKEIGDYVVDEILEAVSRGSSPVNGLGSFKRLNKDYAKDQKGGNTTANLDLFGDMLDSLTFKNTAKGIEVGIFKSSEVPKADGHNNFSGKSTLPLRRFIPDESEDFKKQIEDGIKDIVDEFKRTEPTNRDSIFSDLFTVEETETLEIADLFNDDSLEAYLRQNGYIQ